MEPRGGGDLLTQEPNTGLVKKFAGRFDVLRGRFVRSARVFPVANSDPVLDELDEEIARIQAELARIAEQRTRDARRRRGDKTKARNQAAHVRAEYALRDHPSLGRWLIQQPNGRLKVNTAKVTAE